MRISGLQKLTLLDFPGKIACTVFTAGCNFRCPFCHNPSLVLPGREPAELPDAAVLDYLKKRKGVLEGVCITGGEPLLQTDLLEFIEQVKALGLSVKLDTNGSFPEKLKRLTKDRMVDYVAMDIKNCRERYGETAGIPDFHIEPILESASSLLNGFLPYEFRTTVVRELHSRDDLYAIGQWLRGAKRYFLQSFRDTGDLICTGLHAYSETEMHRLADAVRTFIPSVEIRGK